MFILWRESSYKGGKDQGNVYEAYMFIHINQATDAQKCVNLILQRGLELYSIVTLLLNRVRVRVVVRYVLLIGFTGLLNFQSFIVFCFFNFFDKRQTEAFNYDKRRRRRRRRRRLLTLTLNHNHLFHSDF